MFEEILPYSLEYPVVDIFPTEKLL